MIKRSIALALPSFTALSAAAQRFEDVNIDRVWTTELRGRDAIVRAQHVATTTQRIAVGTGIAYAFTRHPLAMAAAAVEGYLATGGRLTIGVGAGTAHTRSEFGLDFDHPAPRLAEYVGLMRAAVEADGKLEFCGRFYDVRMPGFTFGQPRSIIADIRFYAAALMPTALTAVAAVCDGVALHPFGHVEAYLDEVVRPRVTAGSQRAGRPVPRVAAWMIACALDDPAEARALARAQIALYAAQPGFAGFFTHTRWSAQSALIRDETQLTKGRQPWRDIGTRLVPDEMLNDLAAAGTPAQVRAAIRDKERQLERQRVDELTLQIPAIALPPGADAAVLDGLTAAVAR